MFVDSLDPTLYSHTSALISLVLVVHIFLFDSIMHVFGKQEHLILDKERELVVNGKMEKTLAILHGELIVR